MFNPVYLILMAGPLLLFSGWCLLTYNNLVKKRNLVEDAWSGIDVQLQRRNNLIPNLVETVNKFTDHKIAKQDSDYQSSIPTGRTLSVKSIEESESGRSQLLQQILSEAEKHPEIKSDRKFAELQNSLNTLETEIQQARRYYNGAAREYNTKVESFPANILAMQFGFLQAEYFELEDLQHTSAPT